ncbi:hypothetical protein HRE53_28650 (plasmid) [Acaryochloris sp. 'Moss Beach']|nr:hypothetical protein [Acaryochloris sp. 'Moss Beach']UJB72564.1 hypothetical protein HRE53_28650 [Acaryochloris sp. 'Moss Beach']
MPRDIASAAVINQNACGDGLAGGGSMNALLSSQKSVNQESLSLLRSN